LSYEIKLPSNSKCSIFEMIIMATLSPTSEGVVIFFISDQPKKMGKIAPSVIKKIRR